MFRDVSAKPAEFTKPNIPLCDRKSHLEATLLGVMAEHSLPFTMAPVLIELSKTLAADRKALNHLSMDRTTASYKMRFGLALSFRQSTLSHLQTQYFSLNLDESTSSNLMRVLSVLVSYFCPKSHQVIVEHLCSFSVTKVNAASLYQEICDVFENQNIPWEKLVSILSDSCNVMRGCKSGLEVRIRNGKANHLLDIDGDSCHHIHNAAKVFCKPFAWYVEGLFTDVHNDFKWSVDLRDALAEICNLIGIAFTMPERFISHRWLSCHDVAMSTSRLLDAYWLFYYAFLPKESITVYTSTVLSIYKERDVSHEAQARIREIRKVLSQKNMTEDGKKRKKRIIEKLFYQKKKTCLTMRFYISAFQLLKQYVCMFETKQPLIHKLHDEQEEVFRGFLSCFVKPEVLDGKTAKTMATMDLSKEDVLLKKKQMFVGDGAKLIIEKCSSSDAIVNDFLTAVTKGYVDCAIYMQKKLPLNSKTLRCISAIDPVARGHSLTLTRLKVLPSILNIFTTEEAEAYNIEVHRYQVDPTLPSPDDNGSPIRVDKWWALAMKKYPTLGKLVIALLSCFHGPQVESSFSIMGDVIDKKSGRIKIETFDAIQTIKYGLLAQGKSALEVFDRKNYLHDPVDTRICNNLRGAYSKYKSELDVKRKKADEKRELYKLQKEKVETKARAKRLQKLMDKKARLAHIRKFRLISKSKFAKK